MAKKTMSAAKSETREISSSGAVDVDPTATRVKETKTRATAVPPAKKTSVKPMATTSDVTNDMTDAITNDIIAEKAYHLWLAGHPGSDHDHWLAAERELHGK